MYIVWLILAVAYGTLSSSHFLTAMDKTAITSFVGDLWRNRLSRYSLLFGVVGLLFFLALPVGSKFFLRQWLLNNGADTATIDKITLNPFTGRFLLENVNVTRNKRTVLTNSTIYVNLGVRALFDREALLEKATLTRTLIEIKRYGGGSLRIGSYRTSPEDDQPGRPEEVPWVFRAQEIELSDVMIRYSGDGLQLTLQIDSGTAKRFTTDPQGAAGTVELEGKLNGAPLKLHLSVLKVTPELDLEGELKCSGFPLGALAGIFGDNLTRLAGRVRADTNFTVQNRESGLTVTLKGRTGLADIDIAGSGWTASGELALDGGLGYTSATPSGQRVAVDGLLIARPISFALPEKNLGLTRTAATLQGATTIDIGEAVTVRSDAGLSLADTDLQLTDLAIKTGPGTWTGTVDFNSGKGAEPLRLTADGGVDLQDLLLVVPGMVELSQQRLKTRGVTRLTSEDTFKVEYQGSIDSTNTRLKTESLSVQGEAIAWQGDAAYDSGRELQLKGTAKAERAAVELIDKKMQTSMGSLSFTGDARLAFGETFSYTGATSLSAADLHLADNKSPLADLGRIAIETLRGDNGSLTADTVVTEAVNLPRSELLPVRIAFDRGELQKMVADQNLNNVSFDELTLLTPSVTDDQDVPFARLAALALANGTLRDQSVLDAANLRLDNGAFLFGPGEGRQEPLFTVVAANGSPFSWTKEQGTRIEKVIASDLVVRYQNEQLESRSPEPEKPPGESRRIPLRIDSLQVGGDSILHYTDPTFDPAFQTTIAVISLNVKDIDLNRPEEAMSFQLEAMVDKYAPLSLAGSFAPLASPFRLQQKGTLKNYSLHSISPFAIKAVGIALESGQLDLSSDVTITGQEMQSDNKLDIKNIEIAKRDEERARSLESGLPVPLDVAIDILSDRKGVIAVSVPINGKLSDLQYGVQGIVVTALRKAIAQGIVPALAFTALGPTGALVYLGMKISRSLIDTGLPVLQFAPNRADLSTGQKAILNKVGATLQREMREGDSTFSICPKVVPGETDEGSARRDTALTREERRKELYRLGEKRAQAVQRYLVETFNLDESRLFICNPTLNTGESASGSVEFRK